MKASIQWQQRRVADVNDILQSMGLIARLAVQLTSSKQSETIRSFWYMQGRCGKDTFGLKDMTLAEIITEAKKLEEPDWIKVTTICMALIGKEVWVDKDVRITVDNIYMSKDKTAHIKTPQGRTYQADDLWIKR